MRKICIIYIFFFLGMLIILIQTTPKHATSGNFQPLASHFLGRNNWLVPSVTFELKWILFLSIFLVLRLFTSVLFDEKIWYVVFNQPRKKNMSILKNNFLKAYYEQESLHVVNEKYGDVCCDKGGGFFLLRNNERESMFDSTNSACLV